MAEGATLGPAGRARTAPGWILNRIGPNQAWGRKGNWGRFRVGHITASAIGHAGGGRPPKIVIAEATPFRARFEVLGVARAHTRVEAHRAMGTAGGSTEFAHGPGERSRSITQSLGNHPSRES